MVLDRLSDDSEVHAHRHLLRSCAHRDRSDALAPDTFGHIDTHPEHLSLSGLERKALGEGLALLADSPQTQAVHRAGGDFAERLRGELQWACGFGCLDTNLEDKELPRARVSDKRWVGHPSPRKRGSIGGIDAADGALSGGGKDTEYGHGGIVPPNELGVKWRKRRKARAGLQSII